MTEQFNPLVSIVIPVYNGSNYMCEAIDSALAQTYKNIEVLVINDGSTDNGATKDIALRYGKKIRYYEKGNGGVATALNLGIKKMKGEYFSWLSHDDVYYPDKIENQILFLKNEDKTMIIYSDYDYISINNKRKINTNGLYSEVSRNGYYALLFNYIHGCTLLIPKICFNIVGDFNENLITTNDYELFFRLLKNFKFKYSDKKSVMVRSHPKQDSKIKRDHHYQECNRLWIDFIESLSPMEIYTIEKKLYIFYKKMYNFLKFTPYEEAFLYIKKKLLHGNFENKYKNIFIAHIPIISGILFNSYWFISIKRIILKYFIYKIKDFDK